MVVTDTAATPESRRGRYVETVVAGETVRAFVPPPLPPTPPIDILGLSNGARAGLTGFVAGLSRKTIANGVTINNLLPGPFLTDRIRSTAQAEAKARNTSVDDVIAHRSKENPSGRIGDPAEFGAACAFLCSAHAGFMTGQNILLDGGAFRGTM